jgi:O-antigen ligase
MVKLLTILSMLFALLTLVSLPWVAPVLYTTFSILQPQYVWFWAFDGIPAFNTLAGLTLVSWVIQASQKRIDFSIYALPINKALLLLALLFNMSNWLATYDGGVGADLILNIFNTTMLLYFTSIALFNNESAVRYLTYGFILTAVYYGYDANMAYFENDWSRFSQGRLGGPARGAYSDNNKFAIMMVTGFPFLLLGFFHFKNIIIKTLLVIGMVWVVHGIFLTESRGALLAIGAAVFISTRVINLTGAKRKLINFAILAGFVVVVIDQAGGTLSRTQKVVALRETAEEPLNPRIMSWKVGLKIISDYPVFGVGVYGFRRASMLEHPGESPHVAHNTFLTFAANSGLPCGLLYLYTFWACFKMTRRINRTAPKNSFFKYSANSAFAALGGFFVGALFLDLIIFEPYYYLMMLVAASYFQVVSLEKSAEKNVGIINNV